MTGKEIDPLTFPGYRLIVELGAGRNGRVYRARELETQRLVALKAYRPEVLGRAGFVSGLDSAALAARRFKHPAASRVYGLIEARKGGRLALAMELVGGEVLARALQRNVRFSVVRALRLAKDLAAALADAHEAGLVAGVLHPGHVVVYGESAKLLGLGWSAVEGLPAEYEHTPDEGRFAPAAYAAPEVLSGSRFDQRSDVFALGAVLYHMLTGLVPFRARDMAGLKLERTEGLRWPRGADSLIPPEVIGLVGRALELDAALRPTASEFAASAGRILSGRSSSRRGAPEASAAPAGPQITATAELPPSEPAAALPARAPGATRRVGDMILGALAAAVLIGAGLGAGKLVWGGPRETAKTGSERVVEGPEEIRPKGGTAAPGADAARREWQAILAALEEKPVDTAAVKERLRKLAEKHPESQYGINARLKLAAIIDAGSRARLALYKKLSAEAASLEKRGRFGAALALLDKPPAELAGTELAARALREATALRGRAAASYKATGARAERSVADDDLGSAIADYQGVIDKFGIPEFVAKARRRADQLGSMQEAIAARSAREKEEIRRAKAARALKAGLARARANVNAFKYAAAVVGLQGLATDAGQPEDVRKLIGLYVKLILDEKKLFERAARRVKDDVKELTISVGGSEVLTVKKLDEQGLTAEGRTVSNVFFKWSRVPAAQVYRAIKLTIDVTSAEEHLALATFAWHRGQRMEMENGLKLAAELEKKLAAEARAQAEVYKAIDAVLAPRRAGGTGPGEDPPPRRKAE